MRIRVLPRVAAIAVAGYRLDAAEETAPVAAAAPRLPAGIVVDDQAAKYTGRWVLSSKQPALFGDSYYRHDDNQDCGQKSARFTASVAARGQYEVRLLYVAHPNRASQVQVTVAHADGEQKVTVNQREPVLVGGVPRALGVFTLAPDKPSVVTVSNAGAEGFVVVDAVQFVPREIAQAERAG
ncbi:MAG: hypothetical protein KJZ87_04770 [Thermoguttaceae bacterium]|nr:hypothetical protein [Thermoguttaceae bacterium]